MLANQLKMLDLSTKASEEQSSQVMKRFRANWDSIQSQKATRKIVTLKVKSAAEICIHYTPVCSSALRSRPNAASFSQGRAPDTR
jgi:hypothetical protein